MSSTFQLGAIALLLGMAGCATTTTTPNELVDARTAYKRAEQSPDAQYAPAEMHAARLALDDAERRYDKNGDDQSTRDAAYVASRRAVAAQAKGQAMRTLEDERGLQAELRRLRADEVAQLNRAKGALTRSDQQLQSERAARVAAEKKANDALSSIQGLKTEQTERGLVLTLSGSVLFNSNSSTLLPAAQQRLAEVANALRDDRRSMSIIGHTDSTGSDELNQRLSQQRADAVRAFLAQHGVPADRMTTMGVGKAQPVADNRSPEGRANNRRVEIVLQRSQDQQR